MLHWPDLQIFQRNRYIAVLGQNDSRSNCVILGAVFTGLPELLPVRFYDIHHFASCRVTG